MGPSRQKSKELMELIKRKYIKIQKLNEISESLKDNEIGRKLIELKRIGEGPASQPHLTLL